MVQSGSGNFPARNVSDRGKNSDTVLNGHNYPEWHKRTITAIAKDGAKLVTIYNNIEAGYKAANDIDQLIQFPKYDKLQNVSQGIITKRLKNADFRIVKDCHSTLHMLEILDQRYNVVNDISAVSTHAVLNFLIMNQKSNI